MPFRSTAQRQWMYATHPAMAARWSVETPKGRGLPPHVRRALAVLKTRAGRRSRP